MHLISAAHDCCKIVNKLFITDTDHADVYM